MDRHTQERGHTLEKKEMVNASKGFTTIWW